jgi:hypothetical protein
MVTVPFNEVTFSAKAVDVEVTKAPATARTPATRASAAAREPLKSGTVRVFGVGSGQHWRERARTGRHQDSRLDAGTESGSLSLQ